MTSRAAIVDLAIDVALSFALVSAALALVFAHRGLAPLAAVPALFIALRPSIWRDGLSLLRWRRLTTEPWPKAVLAMALFCALIAASAAWSPTEGAVKLALMHLLAMLVCGAIAYEIANAAQDRARRLAAVYALAASAAAALLMFEGLSGGYLREITPPEDLSHLRWKDMTALGRGAGAAAIMIAPAAAIIRILTKSWIAALAPAGALMIAAMNFTITTNMASLSLALVAFAAAFMAPRASLTAIAAIIILTIIVAPLFSVVPVDRIVEAADLPPSWAQRLLVWRSVAERAVSDCLPLGCGADYARAWSLEGRMIDVKGSTIPLQEIPTHPHNVFLQVWLELGPAGAALLALSVLFGTRALDRLEIPRLTVAALAAAEAAIYCSFMVEASLWQVWRFGAAALAIFGAALSYAVNGRGIVDARGGGRR